MILSYAETTAALLAGAKTVTRRDWSDGHARKFQAGALVQAWDKTPRVKGAKRVGTVRILRSPYQEWSCEAPPEDYAAEGFAYMTEHGLTLFGGATPDEVWRHWHGHDLARNSHVTCELLWVVRFELVAVLS